MSEQNTLEFQDVTYYYVDGPKQVNILSDASYTFQRGQFYTILGPSGSGKTTILALASALDLPRKGTILYEGRDIRKIGLSNYRQKHVSIIFQSYNLIPYLNAVQNVTTAMAITKGAPLGGKDQAFAMLEKVGLTRSEGVRNINRLSGGQQQRVAIARAIACDMDLILADEPTGNLDHETAEDIVTLFSDLARKENKCVMVVTHSQDLAQRSDHILHLKDGQFSA